jgi:hypothetical protein
MNWREMIAQWLAGRSVILGGELKITELVELLVERNMIPAWLAGSDTLYTVLLTQVMWETLKGMIVPRAHQGMNFTYYMNAKEVMNMDMAKKSGLQFLALEKETGVNLDNYYKLRIENALPVALMVSTEGAGLDTGPVVDEAAIFRERLAQDMKQLRSRH